jgi:hypothetical protein
MKTIWRLALAMICVALMYATAHAAPFQQTSGGRSASAAGGHLKEVNRQAAERTRLRGRAILPEAKRPTLLPNSRKRVAGAGFLLHRSVNHAASVRPPGVGRFTISSFPNVRHHGPNPAVVAGSANVASRNTGAIDGTHMTRRP